MLHRGASGRADLLRAYADRGEPGLLAMARALGFEARPERLNEESDRGGDRPEPVGGTAESTALLEVAPVPFWRLEQIDYREPEPMAQRVTPTQRISFEGLGQQPGEPPLPPPLAPAARLWPVLRQRLRSTVASRVVDAEALAELWSRGRGVRRLPFKPLPAWAPRITVLVDRSLRSIPFWDDQDRWLRQLRRHLGRATVHEVRRVEGYDLLWRDSRYRYRHLQVRPEEPVLALSDLGFLAGPSVVDTWRTVAHRLRRSGVQCHALVPCPRNRWEPSLAKLWGAIEWEQPQRTSRSLQVLDESTREARCDRLLTLLSFATRVEPALLRAVRRLLPATEADAATETDLWHHPAMGAGFSKTVSLAGEARPEFQSRFAALPDDLKRGVVATLRSWRAGQPREIWLEEVLALDSAAALPPGTLHAEEIAASRTLWRRIAETLDGSIQPHHEVARALHRYTRSTVRHRQPAAVWGEAALGSDLWRAWSAAWEGEGEPPLPAGVHPERWGGATGSVRRWQLRQVGDNLCLYPPLDKAAPGSPVVEVESANSLLGWRQQGASLAEPHPLAEAAAVPLPLGPMLTLETDRTSAVLRQLEMPRWASSIGRDPFGLWAAFAVGGVEQRLRWIPPGRFWMGSPESEAGRWGDEGPRRLVTLTRGYWLADTACTQALWEVVMGENPSRLQSPNRPVEQVSWEDCQSFVSELNSQVDGLDARLPTEAEWENGCRAGTETATYVGDLEIVGERNAPLLNSIAWYGGNSGEDFELERGVDSSDWPEVEYRSDRAGTHPVARKEANSWGLYDTLGNVYEWCSDWFAKYDAEQIKDPQGPEEGARRVRRGGSWVAHARDVRAAYRGRVAPSDRWGLLGFRLARGQAALQAGAEPGYAERSLGARRGTRRRLSEARRERRRS